MIMRAATLVVFACVTFTSISKIDTGEVSCVDIGTDTYISVSFESIA